MSLIPDLLRQHKNQELWQLCCGFLDLDIAQFMAVQKQLLLEQIELLKRCRLGDKLLRGTQPSSVQEFRDLVPLTDYRNYCPELIEQREDILPAKPVRWIQTSGKGGQYPCKWVPVSGRFWEESGLAFTAVAILGSCRRKGDVAIKSGMKILHAAAPPPTLTDSVARRLALDMGCTYLPGFDQVESLPFQQRVENGFNLALYGGMDAFFGLAAVLVAMGNKFKQGTGKRSKTQLLKHPRALARLGKGYLKSKLSGSPMLPKDLWSLTYIASMGTDCDVFKTQIRDLWGRLPLNVYGNTESTILATQTWDYKDMVFFPNLNFLEFIPEAEYRRSQSNPLYQPKTLLLDEVQSGQIYELVITSFHGGAMVRYRLGDLIRINSLTNPELGINLPQIVLEGRADDLIDLGFIRLNERLVWKALENSGIPYKEWTAHKEIGEVPRIHLYLELAPGFTADARKLADRVYQEIKKLDDGLYVYKELTSLEPLIDYQPVQVTLLESGIFSGLPSLKPPHINPSEDDLALLGVRSASKVAAAPGGR